MAEPLIKFSRSGATDLVFNAYPANLKGLDPAVDVAQMVTAGDVLHTQELGAESALITIDFPKGRPLDDDTYDGGFDWLTKTQESGTQSLANWFVNVCKGGLNSFTLTRGGDTATVNMVNAPTLGLKPHEDKGYIGSIILRVQYT